LASAVSQVFLEVKLREIWSETVGEYFIFTFYFNFSDYISTVDLIQWPIMEQQR
jgi:hypothetical protein